MKLYLLLVAVVGLQRLLELRLSARNERLIRARGGYEVGASHFPFMRALHFLWFVAILAELGWRGFHFWWPGLVLVAAGQGLRYAAITSLGSRWCVKAMVVPGEQVVRRGIYRRFRHPNYLGVVLELLGLPLAGGLLFTAVAFSAANLALLRVRIQEEEKGLMEDTDYLDAFGRH